MTLGTGEAVLGHPSLPPPEDTPHVSPGGEGRAVPARAYEDVVWGSGAVVLIREEDCVREKDAEHRVSLLLRPRLVPHGLLHPPQRGHVTV